MEIHGVPIFYIVPLLVFGPMFITLWFVVGGRTLFKPTQETLDQRQLVQEEKARVAEEYRKKRARLPTIKKDRVVTTPVRWAAQIGAYAIFAMVIGIFSSNPDYRAHPDDQGLLKLSLSLPGKHMEACHRRTSEELAKLAPNMRTAMKCSRARWPVTVDLELDGQKVYHRTVAPAGLSGDGTSSFYARFPIATGRHILTTRIRDSGPDDGAWDYIHEAPVMINPARVSVVGFESKEGHILYR